MPYPWFTSISDGVTNVNGADVNPRFQALADAIQAVQLGTEVLTSPNVASTGWTNAQHDHSAANKGGKLEAINAIKSTGVTSGWVLKADGANAVTWAADVNTLTTKGDILTRTSSALTRLAVGSNESVLAADSAQTPGLKWTTRTRMALGSYTGDGAATKAITGLGFQPTAIFVFTLSVVTNRVFGLKTSTNGGTVIPTARYSSGLDLVPLIENDHIVSLDSDGFTVGDGTGSTANYFNGSGTVYNYIALRG